MLLDAVIEIKEDHKPFQNPEDAASCNDFIPDNDESSDHSDSDSDNDNFHNDAVVENNYTATDKNNTTQEYPTLLTKPSPHSLRVRNNRECPFKKI